MVIAQCFYELGYSEIHDCNGEENLGFLKSQVTAYNGERWSPAKAFLTIAKDRVNLHVIKHAHVTKLDMSKDGNTVNGVNFVINGHKEELKAFTKKEVILSAGSLNTPKILMLSGIGPKKHLENLNIKVLHDLAVGGNLQDHAIVPVLYNFHKSSSIKRTLRDLADATYQYNLYRAGLLSHIDITDYMGFISTVNDTRYPDMQIHTFYCAKNEPMIKKVFELYGYNDEIIQSVVEANAQSETVIFVLTLLNPKSIGKVKLRSSDPFDSPKLIHNYFKEQEDVDTMVRAIKQLHKITTTKMYDQHEGDAIKLNIPECNALDYNTDQYWECYSRYMTSTLYHPIGTAKMGPAEDKDAVVDSRLNVKGVKGLRVVDASIMPKIVSGNTNAATIMIGEKASDFIKEKWTAANSLNKDEL